MFEHALLLGQFANFFVIKRQFVADHGLVHQGYPEISGIKRMIGGAVNAALVKLQVRTGNFIFRALVSYGLGRFQNDFGQFITVSLIERPECIMKFREYGKNIIHAPGTRANEMLLTPPLRVGMFHILVPGASERFS